MFSPSQLELFKKFTCEVLIGRHISPVMKNTIHRRSESNWIGKAKGNQVSINYWRKEARQLFAMRPELEIVEIVHTGRKTDSALLKRGKRISPFGTAVIIASTGGTWGRSRRNFNANLS